MSSPYPPRRSQSTRSMGLGAAARTAAGDIPASAAPTKPVKKSGRFMCQRPLHLA